MNHELHQIDAEYGAGETSFVSYVFGFVLSVLLTLIPYFAVVRHALSGNALIMLIFGAGILQLLTQLIFFLHLSKRSKARWNIIVLLFSLLIVFILVGGSIWIMYHLNRNMTIDYNELDLR